MASIDYRFSQEAIFPAQIEDCKAAIRFLRANAAKYAIAGNHIGVAGDSAGGHLVELLGTSGGVKDLEGAVGTRRALGRWLAVACADLPRLRMGTARRSAADRTLARVVPESCRPRWRGHAGHGSELGSQSRPHRRHCHGAGAAIPSDHPALIGRGKSDNAAHGPTPHARVRIRAQFLTRGIQDQITGSRHI